MNTTLNTTWTEESARRWLARSLGAWPLIVKRLPKLGNQIEWHEPCELPERYAFNSRPHACLHDALDLSEKFSDLSVAVGFAFRPERKTEGVLHIFNLDFDGGVVDLSSARVGPPNGYLAAVPSYEHLRVLAQLNGVELGPKLAPYNEKVG